MSSTETSTESKVEILFKVELEEEGQTIVHCYNSFEGLQRIWPSTILIDNLGNEYKLIHAEGISIAPNWCMPKLAGNGLKTFTLIFENLAKAASSFRLEEQIPEPGGFYTKDIPVNQTGVYHVQIF